MNDNRSIIIKSALRFFSGTMLSRVTGLFRDVAMAFAFGTQGTVAGFMVAFRFAHLLRRLFGEGALQTAFVPHFEALRKENPDRAAFFFRDLMVSLSVLLLVIIGFISLGLWGALAYFDLNDGNREILYLTLLMMPSLLFICLFGLNASLLQCEKSYFVPGVAPAAFNLIWIFVVMALTGISEEKAMPWLAVGVIVACFSQWLFTVPSTWKFLRNSLYGNLKTHWKVLSPDVKKLATPLFLGMLGIAAAQINNALDAVFARYAESEGPAYLWYAIRIQQLPLALFGIAISGALLPPLARAIKALDYEKYHSFLNFCLRRSLALMIPITLGLFVMGDTCVNLLYGRGDFIGESIGGTTTSLWAYAIGLVPMTLVLILAPAFYALEDYKNPTRASLAAVGINIGLNIWFVFGLNWGAASIALATSFSAWVNALQLGWILHRQDKLKLEIHETVLKAFAASLFAFAAVLTWRFYEGSYAQLWNVLASEQADFAAGFTAQFMQFVTEASVFSAVLGFVAWGLNGFKNPKIILGNS